MSRSLLAPKRRRTGCGLIAKHASVLTVGLGWKNVLSMAVSTERKMPKSVWSISVPGGRETQGKVADTPVHGKRRTHAKLGDYEPCSATIEELEAAFTGRCAICGVREDECKTRLQVDHDHSTGRLRGFLCGKCNRGLGCFGDSVENLASALHYLTNSHK